MFRSFFFAGFECATGYNAHGEWIDQVAATHHDTHAQEDYKRLRGVGIHAARDAIRWPLVDKRGKYDFASARPFVEAARQHGIEVIWDLFHYGYPKDLDPFSEEFVKRFEGYCHAAARFVRANQEGPCFFTPVNEPSYFAWAAGDACRFAPHCRGRSFDLKVQLIRAAIRGIDAIRDAIPGTGGAGARIVNVDPLCRVAPPRPELQRDADGFNHAVVFQSWDMLAGRFMPELGGSREHLDIVGMNYYWTNQWELGRDECPLADGDPRRVPLRDLIRGVWERYGGDLLITETAHVNDMRAAWLGHVADECEALLDEGVPLRGVCLYPILGMPEWHARNRWTAMGLWDLCHQAAGLRRQLCEPMLEALRVAQRLEVGHALRQVEAEAGAAA